jgi:hypothetical protein
MARPRFPADLREFLKLLNSARVEYLLVGGYAVSYYGYPRATAWMTCGRCNHSNNSPIAPGPHFHLKNTKNPAAALARSSKKRMPSWSQAGQVSLGLSPS